jgi:hypothetical protein
MDFFAIADLNIYKSVTRQFLRFLPLTANDRKIKNVKGARLRSATELTNTPAGAQTHNIERGQRKADPIFHGQSDVL